MAPGPSHFEVPGVVALSGRDLSDGLITGPDPVGLRTRYRRTAAPVRVRRSRETPGVLGWVLGRRLGFGGVAGGSAAFTAARG